MSRLKIWYNIILIMINDIGNSNKIIIDVIKTHFLKFRNAFLYINF